MMQDIFDIDGLIMPYPLAGSNNDCESIKISEDYITFILKVTPKVSNDIILISSENG